MFREHVIFSWKIFCCWVFFEIMFWGESAIGMFTLMGCFSDYFSLRTSRVVFFFSFKTTINKWKFLTDCTTLFFSSLETAGNVLDFIPCGIHKQTRNRTRKTCPVLPSLFNFLWKTAKIHQIWFSFYLPKGKDPISKEKVCKAKKIEWRSSRSSHQSLKYSLGVP